MKDISDIVIKAGSHRDPDLGMCIMEAAAYVAGEPHSDHPACVSKTISAFLRAWNDQLQDNEARTRLLAPLIPHILNTRDLCCDTDKVRKYMLFDWMVRVNVPEWLDVVGMGEHSAKLRALGEIVDRSSGKASAAPVSAAYKDVLAASGGTHPIDHCMANVTACYAAVDAADHSVMYEAAKIVSLVSNYLSSDWDYSSPVVTKLQASACDLVIRMSALRG